MAISGEISSYQSVYPPDFCVYSRSEKQMTLSEVAEATVKFAAICGSLWKGSYNKGLIRSAIELSKGAAEGVEIEEVDIASLSMLNTDLEKQETFPAEVEAFRQKILEADSILFASPGYNFSVTCMNLLGNLDLNRTIEERNELRIKATQRVGR